MKFALFLILITTQLCASGVGQVDHPTLKDIPEIIADSVESGEKYFIPADKFDKFINENITFQDLAKKPPIVAVPLRDTCDIKLALKGTGISYRNANKEPCLTGILEITDSVGIVIKYHGKGAVLNITQETFEEGLLYLWAQKFPYKTETIEVIITSPYYSPLLQAIVDTLTNVYRCVIEAAGIGRAYVCPKYTLLSVVDIRNRNERNQALFDLSQKPDLIYDFANDQPRFILGINPHLSYSPDSNNTYLHYEPVYHRIQEE